MIECAVLGPVEIAMDGGAAPRALRWKKHLALLIYLVCAPRRLQGRPFLADLLWGERDDPKARHSLNEAARVLRRTLGDDAVIGGADELGLQRGAVRLDLERFAECAARGAWIDAAALVRGEFLEGFGVADAAAFEDWVAAERLTWRRRSLDALVRASALERDQGNLPAALGLAARAVALEPLSDRAVQARMRAEALGGDREDALATFTEFGQRLRTGLDAEPAAGTIELARCIRLAPRRTAVVPRPDVLPLMDREAELAALSHVWDSVREGHGAGAVIIRGPGGVGRSRLLAELTARAALDGAFVASARAVAGDHATAGGTLLALAGSMLHAAGVPGADPAALATLAATEPAWAERFGSGAVRLPLVAAARAVIAAVAEDAPVVLAVDDAHCADEASIESFELMLRDLAGRPVLLALTAVDHPVRHEIEQLAARIGGDVQGCVVTLGALSPAATERLAGFMLPRLQGEDRARLARRVMHDTAGSPLLATALLRAVRSGLELDLETASWPAPSRTLTATLPGPLPDGLAAAIRLVFRDMGDEAQRVGAAAAALGERLVVGELTRATGLDAPTVERALDELEQRGWIVWDVRGYSFGAQLARDVIARDLLTPGQRRRIRDHAGWTDPRPAKT